MRRVVNGVCLALMFASTAAAQTGVERDSASHTTRTVTVAPDVQLEVLDWGGSGRAVVLLAGMGATAHTFDDFAPHLAANYHVYGITRRGFGRSSAPMYGYGADTLADDVLAVIDSLGLSRPVVVGHSMAGEELSSIGSRHPERVSGLIYLDAGYDYALYDTTHGNATIDLNELIRKLGSLRFGSGASAVERRRTMIALADTTLPALSGSFHAILKDSPMLPGPAPRPMARIPYAMIAGQRKFTSVQGPVLAIFASPPEAPPGAGNDPAMREMITEVDSATETQVRAFARQVPQARVVRIPRANHFLYRSHEARVLQEMRAFINTLPGGVR
jgi:pimeloyl-ACP methyl ester carboxylesterase